MPESKHKQRNIVRAFSETPWAITREKFDAICELLELRASGAVLTEDEIRARIGAPAVVVGEEEESDSRGYRLDRGVAIIPVQGVLSPRLNMMQKISGGTSTQQLSASVHRAVDDSLVKAVVLDVDSPGGSVLGCEECSQAIVAARGDKPIIAVVQGLGASAAYSIASAADEIVASPSSMLGSIGVFLVHRETSKLNEEVGVQFSIIQQGKFKTDGNEFEPLSTQARNTLQERVDDYYQLFVESVALNRDVTKEIVEKNFGQGKVMIAAKAIKIGMADRIGTLEEVVREMSAQPPVKRSSGAVASQCTTGVTAMDIIRAALSKRGMIEENANDDVVQAAVRAFYGAAGKSMPDMSTPEGQSQIVQDLKKEPEAKAAEPAKPTEKAKDDDSDTSFADRQLADKARVDEKHRIQELMERGTALGIDQADIQAAIDNETSLADALVKWTANKSENEKPLETAGVAVDGSSLDRFINPAVEVLAHRIGLVTDEERQTGLSKDAADLQHLRMHEMAAFSLKGVGHNTHGLDAEETCRQFLSQGGEFLIPAASQGGYNRPGAYPNILAALTGKMLDVAMTAAPVTYRQWAFGRPPVPDFHPRSIVRKGGRGELPEWPDRDEITEDNTAEEVSFIRVDRYGDEFVLSPVMMANDDLNAFSEDAEGVMQAHERTINRLGIDLLIGNATAADGNSLFDDTNHGNDITGGSGGAPSITQADLIRQRMQLQTDVSGRFRVGLSPAIVLTGATNLTAAQQVFLPVAALERIAKATDVTINVFRGTVNVVFDPMIDDGSTASIRNDWFTFASTRQARSLVYMFQTGFQSGGRRRSYFNNRTGSRHFQVEGRFGFAIGNWRGVVRNSGGS